MQFVSKKVIAFNILLLHCSIFFGCFNQGQQMICNDNLLIIGANGDGKLKNSLRKTNKFFSKKLSINKNDFLLRLDKGLLTEIDIQKILLKALWRDEKADQIIVECYKRYYNQNEEISLNNFFGDNQSILNAKEIRLHISFFCSSITFKEIKDIKKLSLKNLISKELNSFQKGIHCALQVGALCGDVILVQTISNKIINIFDEMSALASSSQQNYISGENYMQNQHLADQMYALKELNFFEKKIENTKLLLLELMYLNKKEMFQALVDANPLKLKNSSEWTTIVKYFQNDYIKSIDKNVKKEKYIQILEQRLNQ